MEYSKDDILSAMCYISKTLGRLEVRFEAVKRKKGVLPKEITDLERKIKHYKLCYKALRRFANE